ncbi:hypothetical protein GKZ89_04300 [Bacillus mangrovi]|uniref:Uncharacterized protein n=1 Tax=Metabacillus mangrovi TaxID=1491830 RepID=A0A7X2V3Z9_9BACI|nr:hypothetical protein [Metabacillus mangrovi]MTH52619.1 hypothetical protein [Metabacillus mangrovi]
MFKSVRWRFLLLFAGKSLFDKISDAIDRIDDVLDKLNATADNMAYVLDKMTRSLPLQANGS